MKVALSKKVRATKDFELQRIWVYFETYNYGQDGNCAQAGKALRTNEIADVSGFMAVR